MKGRGRLAGLALLMIAVAGAVGAVSLSALYQTAFEQERRRLVETARSQALMIGAVARFDERYSADDVPGGAFAATLAQIAEAHQELGGLGRTGEFTLARLEGDRIVFLLNLRHQGRTSRGSVSFSSELAEPMARALSGESGTVVGPDYRGETVLAAYEPLEELGAGIVAKVDLAEIRAPFVWTVWLAGGGGALLVLAGLLAFRHISAPLVRELEESERRHRELFEQASDPILILDARGERLLDGNAAATSLLGYTRAELQRLRADDVGSWQEAGDGKETLELLPAEGSAVLELELRRKDGSRVPVEASCRLVQLGGQQAALCSVRDVSERKRVEEAKRWESTINGALAELSGALMEPTPSVERIADIVQALARLITDSEAGYVSSIDTSNGDNVVHASTGLAPGGRGDSQPSRQPFYTNTPGPNETSSGSPEWMVPLRCFLSVPATVGETLLGQIALANSPGGYTDRDLGAVERLAELYALAVQRVRTEAALRESEERTRLLLDSTAEGIFGLDLDGRCTFANRSGLRLLGFAEASELLGKNMHALIHHTLADGREHPEEACPIVGALRSGAGVHLAEESFWRRDGSRLPAECWSHPLRSDGTPRGAVVTFVDITERRRDEETLRTLRRNLVMAHEEDRRRIARELHEEVGQALAAAKVGLHALASASEAPAVADQIHDGVRTVDRAIRSVRDLSLELRPTILDDLGLVEALRWLLERRTRGSSLTSDLAVGALEGPVPAEAEIACFRVAQEAVDNTLRHARAGQLWVALETNAGQLEISVRDDGVGFDVGSAWRRTELGGCVGLSRMQERASLLRGRLDVRSAPDAGTRIRFVVPLTSEDDETLEQCPPRHPESATGGRRSQTTGGSSPAATTPSF